MEQFFLFLFTCWLHWVFVTVQRLSPIVKSGGHSLVAVEGLHHAVVSLVAEHRL